MSFLNKKAIYLDDYSAYKAEIERDFRVNILAQQNNKELRRLYLKLTSCTPEYPCSSLACPICVQEKRKDFINTAMLLFEDKEELDFITYIPYPLISKQLKIKDIDIDKIKDKFRCYLKNANIKKFAIGCIEFDYDIAYETWVPHVHCIMEKIDKQEKINLREKINKKHLKTRMARKNRPLVVVPVDNLHGLVRYIYKFMWLAKPPKKSSKSRKKKIRLRRDLFLEHLMYIDKLSMQHLEFRYQLRRNKKGLSFFLRNDGHN